MISTSSHGAVTLQNDEGTLFKVNAHRLKIFLEPKKPPKDLDKVDFLDFTIDLQHCHASSYYSSGLRLSFEYFNPCSS